MENNKTLQDALSVLEAFAKEVKSISILHPSANFSGEARNLAIGQGGYISPWAIYGKNMHNLVVTPLAGVSPHPRSPDAIYLYHSEQGLELIFPEVNITLELIDKIPERGIPIVKTTGLSLT